MKKDERIKALEGWNASLASDKRASGYIKHGAIWRKEDSVFAEIADRMPFEFDVFVRRGNQIRAVRKLTHHRGAEFGWFWLPESWIGADSDR